MRVLILSTEMVACPVYRLCHQVALRFLWASIKTIFWNISNPLRDIPTPSYPLVLMTLLILECL